MAKSHNQKAKILYLERMLRESSTVRPISMQEILDRLGELGIRAERKSIYDDMETLKDFGMAIQYRRGREGGYYLVQERGAEVSEISEAQEMSETAEISEMQEMSETAEISEVQKSSDLAGISEGVEVPENRSEVSGETVVVSAGSQKEELKAKVQIQHTKSPENTVFLYPETPEQEKNGKEIKLLCKNSVRKEVLKALGRKVPCKLKGEDCFTVVIQTEPDRKFYGWLTSMGRSVHILKPKKVAASYREYLKSIAKDYKIDK